jgi:hypothetical protein
VRKAKNRPPVVTARVADLALSSTRPARSRVRMVEGPPGDRREYEVQITRSPPPKADNEWASLVERRAVAAGATPSFARTSRGSDSQRSLKASDLRGAGNAAGFGDSRASAGPSRGASIYRAFGIDERYPAPPCGYCDVRSHPSARLTALKNAPYLFLRPVVGAGAEAAA